MASSMVKDDLAISASNRLSITSPSFRMGSSDVFNMSGRHTQEDDEQELKWAAIERLPTYNRMRNGVLRQVLHNGKVVHQQVDLTMLGLQDRKMLMESILKVAEEDNEKLLRKIRDRVDRVGIEVPKIEVRYENLTVQGEVYVASRALPTLLNSVLNIFESIVGLFHLAPSKKIKVQILRDVSGMVIEPFSSKGEAPEELRKKERKF